MEIRFLIGLILSLFLIAANLPDCIIAWKNGERPSTLDVWGLVVGIGCLIAWLIKMFLL